MNREDFEKLLNKQKEAFNNLLNEEPSEPDFKIVELSTKPINLKVEFPMGHPSDLKWVMPNMPDDPPRKLTPEEIERERIQEERREKIRKEKELQYEKFGVKRSAALVKELRDFTGVGMMDCKKCLERAVYECTTYTKEALFEKAIEFMKELKPIRM